MITRLIKSFSLIALLLSLFSCAMSPGEMVMFDRLSMSYEKAIRWGEFSRAKSFHKKSPTLSDFERRRLKNFRVTDFIVLHSQFLDPYNSKVLADIKYYTNDRPVIKTITVHQHWKRDEDSDIWYLESPFPKFK